MSSILTHDFEIKEGLALVTKLTDVEEQFGFRSSWNIVPYQYDVDLGLIADLKIASTRSVSTHTTVMLVCLSFVGHLSVARSQSIKRKLLERLVEQRDIWHALPSEVSDWWRKRDKLDIDDTGDTPELVGSSADRARIFLRELPPS